jgi:hypothetical protein
MPATIVLALDSMFAGAALGFFGVGKKYWALAWKALGLAGRLALFLGRAFSGAIGRP